MIYTAVLYYYISYYSLAGVGIAFLIMGILICLSKIVANISIKKLSWNDSRNKEMAFTLSGIKNVKLECWESIIKERLTIIRNKEKSLLLRLQFLRAFSDILIFSLPSLASFVSIVIYNSFEKEKLSLGAVFFVLTVFNLLVGPLKLFYFSLSNLFECIKSFNRIDVIMKLPELIPKPNHEPSLKIISMEKASFFYNNPEYDQRIKQIVERIQGKNSSTSKLIKFKNSQNQGFELEEISLQVNPGELVMVIGAVGSGKSSLLKSLLEILHFKSGDLKISGSIAYVSGESFLLNDRFRENITFGRPFDEERYRKAIQLCELKQDLKVLPGGEFTEIGEQGLNLSGGQKQRISLARAFYSDSDIFLIDDSLSALDYHVGSLIFENLILKELKQKNKLILMTTHLLQYLKKADRIIFMKNGRIAAQGTYQELRTGNSEFNQFIMKDDIQMQEPVNVDYSKFSYSKALYDEFYNDPNQYSFSINSSLRMQAIDAHIPGINGLIYKKTSPSPIVGMKSNPYF